MVQKVISCLCSETMLDTNGLLAACIDTLRVTEDITYALAQKILHEYTQRNLYYTHSTGVRTFMKNLKRMSTDIVFLNYEHLDNVEEYWRKHLTTELTTTLYTNFICSIKHVLYTYDGSLESLQRIINYKHMFISIAEIQTEYDIQSLDDVYEIIRN